MKHNITTLTFIATAMSLLSSCQGGTDNNVTLYAGTYGNAIHILSYNTQTGKIDSRGTIPATSASYLALGGTNSRGEDVIYAVSETGETSGVYSFAKGAQGWHQTAYTNEVGADPCFILPIEGSGNIVTADYSGGSYSLFGTDDGAITGRTQVASFETVYDGQPPVAGRQDAAHIHQVREIPASIIKATGAEGRFFLASDLGNDLIRVLRYTGNSLEQISTISCGAGAGPRHMEFNQSANMLYCITELSGEIIAWSISAADSTPVFTEAQRFVADKLNAGGSADIHLHPNGKWLYASHRLQGDGITIMDVDATGHLEISGFRATGIHPRNFTFSPDGKRILVACRDTKDIQVYDIDQNSGMLSESFQSYVFEDDLPVCLVFAD